MFRQGKDDIKPRVGPGVVLDTDHPLSRNLLLYVPFVENGGKVFDLVRRNPLATSATPPSWGAGATNFGRVRRYAAASSTQDTIPLTFSSTLPFTWAMMISIDDHTINLHDRASCGNTSQDGSPSLIITSHNVGIYGFKYWFQNAYTSGVIPVVSNRFYLLCLVYNGNTSWTAYLDGVADATAAKAWATNKSNLYIGSGFNGFFGGKVLFTAAWQRMLSLTEMKQLMYEPFCMLRQPRTIMEEAAAAAGIAIPVLTRQYRERWS